MAPSGRSTSFDSKRQAPDAWDRMLELTRIGSVPTAFSQLGLMKAFVAAGRFRSQDRLCDCQSEPAGCPSCIDDAPPGMLPVRWLEC